MIQLIKNKFLLLILISNLLYSNNNFTFYKAYGYCDTDIGVYSQEEANLLYKNMKINLKDYNIFKKVDKVNYNNIFYSYKFCIEKGLNININNVTIYKSHYKWPFDKVLLFNYDYIMIIKDGFSFIFKKQKNNYKYKIN